MKKRVIVSSLLVLLLTVALVLGLSSVAFAADEDAGAAVPIEAQQLWALLVSVAVPFVPGLLVRKGYAKWLKALIALILAAVIGVVTTYVTGNWSGDVWVIVLACFGVAQTTFFVVVDRVPGLKTWLYEQVNAEPKTVARE